MVLEGYRIRSSFGVFLGKEEMDTVGCATWDHRNVSWKFSCQLRPCPNVMWRERTLEWAVSLLSWNFVHWRRRASLGSRTAMGCLMSCLHMRALFQQETYHPQEPHNSVGSGPLWLLFYQKVESFRLWNFYWLALGASRCEPVLKNSKRPSVGVAFQLLLFRCSNFCSKTWVRVICTLEGFCRAFGTMKACAVSMLVLYLCLGALAAYFGFSARKSSNTRVSDHFWNLLISTAVLFFAAEIILGCLRWLHMLVQNTDWLWELCAGISCLACQRYLYLPGQSSTNYWASCWTHLTCGPDACYCDMWVLMSVE